MLDDAVCWMIPWRVYKHPYERTVRRKGLIRREPPLGSQSCAVAHTKAHAALHDSLFRLLSRSPALPLSSLPQRPWSFPLSTAHSGADLYLESILGTKSANLAPINRGSVSSLTHHAHV